MAGVSLKKDFKDGDKLFAQQLNNNFGAIQAALEAMNKIVWQDDPDDMVVTFRGTTEEINNREVIDGQLLYDTTTGETYIDYGSQRISTGSGNAIFIGATEPSNPSTQLWINPDEPMQVIGSEVVNSLEGNETNKAPSVKVVNDKLDEIDSKFNYSEDEQVIGTYKDGKPIYKKLFTGSIENGVSIEDDIDVLIDSYGTVFMNSNFRPLNYYEIYNNLQYFVNLRLQNNIIYFNCVAGGTGIIATDCNITLIYTKASDTVEGGAE